MGLNYSGSIRDDEPERFRPNKGLFIGYYSGNLKRDPILENYP